VTASRQPNLGRLMTAWWVHDGVGWARRFPSFEERPRETVHTAKQDKCCIQPTRHEFDMPRPLKNETATAERAHTTFDGCGQLPLSCHGGQPQFFLAGRVHPYPRCHYADQRVKCTCYECLGSPSLICATGRAVTAAGGRSHGEGLLYSTASAALPWSATTVYSDSALIS
jgi:hypothetical protein